MSKFALSYRKFFELGFPFNGQLLWTFMAKSVFIFLRISTFSSQKMLIFKTLKVFVIRNNWKLLCNCKHLLLETFSQIFETFLLKIWNGWLLSHLFFSVLSFEGLRSWSARKPKWHHFHLLFRRRQLNGMVLPLGGIS